MKQNHSFELADYLLILAIILCLIFFAPAIGNLLDRALS